MKITACDLDKQTPAKTYTITAEGESPVELDLCGEHSAPIEELIGRARAAREGADQAAEEPGPAPVPKRGPARRAAAKKATARKAAPAKRTATKAAARAPKIMTLEEIEAQKRNKG
ncbi:hypothetical protein OG923_12700 [Streptomyces halstedii]|uniref:hypothetical protein n=1 Tax=Streptomyces halstedii TaxID=1944 RepID=UPI003246836D